MNPACSACLCDDWFRHVVSFTTHNEALTVISASAVSLNEDINKSNT